MLSASHNRKTFAPLIHPPIGTADLGASILRDDDSSHSRFPIAATQSAVVSPS